MQTNPPPSTLTEMISLFTPLREKELDSTTPYAAIPYSGTLLRKTVSANVLWFKHQILDR